MLRCWWGLRVREQPNGRRCLETNRVGVRISEMQQRFVQEFASQIASPPNERHLCFEQAQPGSPGQLNCLLIPVIGFRAKSIDPSDGLRACRLQIPQRILRLNPNQFCTLLNSLANLYQADGPLSRTARARWTLARMSATWAVQVKDAGLAL